MIKLELISVRRLDRTPIDQFHHSDHGIEEYIKQHFQDTNKLISMSTSISKDYSTQTKTLIFKSHDAYTEFLNDKILQYQEKVIQFRYNNWHNITTNKIVEEI